MSAPSDLITRRLQTLARENPELREAANVYQVLLPIVQNADLHVEPVTLTREQARERMMAGQPLLQNQELALDLDAARTLMIALARALENIQAGESRSRANGNGKNARMPDTLALYDHAQTGQDGVLRAAAARQIRLALEANCLEMEALLPRVAVGDSGFVAELAASLQLDPALVWTLGQNVLKPALRVWAQQLAPLMNGLEWGRGYCFVCGSGATLGELQGNDGVKHLRCGQCGADWATHRGQCMYCGNQDHKTYGFFYPEGQREKLRIEVCDACGGYAKVISTFEPLPPALVQVEDLATLQLDYIAQERGYARVAFQS